jgi:hypothetical protein
MNALYEKDFVAWSHEQAIYLRNGDFANLDIEHLIQEMGEMGSSNRDAIENHLDNLILHLLKVENQPEKLCNSWNASIANARNSIRRIIRKNPSLKKYPSEVVEGCYQEAIAGASRETGIAIKLFPKECPWDLNYILGE